MEELKICVSVINCKSLKIVDKTLWTETVPDEDIISTYIKIEKNGIVYETTLEGYYSEVILENIPLFSTNTFSDGFYIITFKYLILEAEDEAPEVALITTEIFLNKCNLQCKYHNLILETIDDCDECNKKKWEILFMYQSKLDVLEAAIVCKDLETAKKLFEYLNNLLINIKCKSC